jgi:uncharacterized protein
MTKSALYIGSVIHRRTKPISHRLRTRIFWLLLDLDEIDALAASSRIFRANRIGALSFFASDYGDEGRGCLRVQVADWLAAENIQADGPVRLLTMPRIFNFVFNPLSVYFCFGSCEDLRAIIYEVHNTFGERKRYILPARTGARNVQHECAKDFYVSPFLPPDLLYRFRVEAPTERVQIAIRCLGTDGFVMAAALAGERREFNDANLAAALVRFPFMTFKVWAEIHWNAFRLYLKGLHVFSYSSAGVRR